MTFKINLVYNLNVKYAFLLFITKNVLIKKTWKLNLKKIFIEKCTSWKWITKNEKNNELHEVQKIRYKSHFSEQQLLDFLLDRLNLRFYLRSLILSHAEKRNNLMNAKGYNCCYYRGLLKARKVEIICM